MVMISGVERINVPVGGDTVVFVCRRPTGEELSTFLSSRFETKGRKVKSRLYEARTALIDKILIDVEGAEFADAKGQVKALNAATVLSEDDKRVWSGIVGATVESWKDLIAVSWKSSAAMHFEDAQSDDEGGSGN